MLSVCEQDSKVAEYFIRNVFTSQTSYLPVLNSSGAGREGGWGGGGGGPAGGAGGEGGSGIELQATV